MPNPRLFSPKEAGWAVDRGSRCGRAGWIVYQPGRQRLSDRVFRTKAAALRELSRRRTEDEWQEVIGAL